MTARPTVLISGAGVAGLALAHWLHRGGHAVTVVEKADGPRDGGYPVDLRGTAVEVARRTGILPRLREAHVDLRRATFLRADGTEVASIPARAVAGGTGAGHLEVRRGDLTAALYAGVRDDVEFLFGDRADTLDDRAHGVDVTFRGGRRRTFDLVVGADGVHSATRGAVFGAEERFHHYLGHVFGIYTMPNTLGLSHELTMWNAPGRAAALYAAGAGDEALHAFLTFHRPTPPGAPPHREALAAVFADAGWEVPRMLDALRDADDLFVDTAGRIRMPRWSRGLVALVGDAAYAPSFLTGQGTSLALTGAYTLARTLAAHRDPATAFVAYERVTRPYVTANQALAGDGGATLFPTTAEALERRDTRLRSLATLPPPPARPAYSALALPD
ncbi:FAD-dependent monooxygenase [Streptomyces viridochromogenes]|uniref:FAD-dependent monooxygenase n=1 Tax=Streptomyces viridochromogenes TaxID=1938 RepID=UPI0031CE6DE2